VNHPDRETLPAEAAISVRSGRKNRTAVTSSIGTGVALQTVGVLSILERFQANIASMQLPFAVRRQPHDYEAMPIELGARKH
jgi:hypothetical protein